MSEAKRISRCRVSGSTHLIPILHLGDQALTGVFPKTQDEKITSGPLELVWNPDSGLVQLSCSYPLDEMYGDNYGYRSGLNQSMVEHLGAKVRLLERLYSPSAGDTVLDIGSNDGTTLSSYTTANLNRIGIDPTAEKFRQYYPKGVKVVADFFSADNYRKVSDKPAKIVTSLAMFYDLEEPIGFAREVASILDKDAVWHFEQSYMPAMLRTTSYDTVCHEHLEYYSLETVKFILEAADLKLVDVVMNSVNGGSFAVTAARKDARWAPNTPVIQWLLEQEERLGLNTVRPFREFEERVFRHREDLTRLIRDLRASGKKVLGYGASTKGNVLLQFCGFGPDDIEAIAEVNPEKFGRFTPRTNIPIISETEARAMKPDYFLVLPWHFREGIVKREAEFLAGGGHLIFPLPEIEIR